MGVSPRIAAIVLAAGQGRRFGGFGNKLLADLDGRPVLRRAVEAALGARTCRTIVVIGHDRAAVEAALDGLPVVFAHNPDFASGLAASLRAGLAVVGEADVVVVLLGDMPGVRAETVNALIDAFAVAPGASAIVPLRNGRRGNPVLLARALFPRVETLRGDEGARRLLAADDSVLECAVDDDGVLADVDAPADLDKFRAPIRRS
ncbi:MAG: nucleotidyltransferase family protein [Methylocystis sp.]|uniref:nucleotidyltransferase family protein n=1 Tax=Methylocystis sp. TaxID=1911079 RepID=UPI003DA5C09E